MQQVKNTHSADDTLSIAFPFATLENQLTLRNDRQFHPPLSGAVESAEQLNSIMRAEIALGRAPNTTK
jgi:hypothetical protein